MSKTSKDIDTTASKEVKVLSQAIDMIVRASVAEKATKASKPAKPVSTKLFQFVGFAVDAKGRSKVRFTNDKNRVGTLVRGGCTNVTFVTLPNPMTKEEICASEYFSKVSQSQKIAA